MACAARAKAPFPMSSDATFCIASTPLAVRQGLLAILDHPILVDLSESARGSAELVLAEALNNIVEHAYQAAEGTIEVRLQRRSLWLCCYLVDAGAPMPNNELPAGLAQTIGADQDLAEGGFGWFLIRTLTTDLVYRRIDARNHLSFQLNVEQ